MKRCAICGKELTSGAVVDNECLERLKEDGRLLKFLITMILEENGYTDCRDLDYQFECNGDCFSEECLKLIKNAIKKDMEKSIRLGEYEE